MRTSASQLDKVQNCVRAAAFHYVDGIRKPGLSEFAKELGKRIHHYVRLYVRFGLEPDLTEIVWKEVLNPRTQLLTRKPIFPGQIAAAAFPLLKKGPLGTEAWYTETSIAGVQLPSGIELSGDIDLAIDEPMATWLDARTVPGTFEPVGEIRDYKTTSDFQHAKTEAQLLSDIQANFYALAWFKAVERGQVRMRGPAVNLHWQYLLTKGNARSHSVRALTTRERNAQEIERIDRNLASPWAQIRVKKISGYALPPTGLGTGACEKYNGCPYRGVECQPTVEETLRYGGYVNQPIVDLNALLSQKLATQQTLTQVAPPAFQAPAGPPPGASNPFGPAATVTKIETGETTVYQKTARPSFWIPGDPMNEVQQYAESKGKPLSYIANAADNPPPPEVSASYDVKVEAGKINPPESAGMIPAANPAAAQALAGVAPVPAQGEEAGFEALKAECVRLGIYPAEGRPRTAGLKKLLDGYEAERAAAERQGLIPPGARPPIAALRVTPQAALLDLPMAPTAQIAQAFQAAGVPVQAAPNGALDFAAVPRAGDPVVAPFGSTPEQDLARYTELADLVADRVIARLAEALKKLA